MTFFSRSVYIHMYNVQCGSLTHVQCTMWLSHPCTMYNVALSPMYNVQCGSLTHVQCTMWLSHPCTMYNVALSPMYNVQCGSHPCTMYNVALSPMYNVQCGSLTHVQCTMWLSHPCCVLPLLVMQDAATVFSVDS